MKASEQQKADLRAAMDRSREEYEADMAARRERLRLAPAPVQPTAFDLCGDIAEQVTALALLCEPLGDDVGAANEMGALREAVTQVGNRLARIARRQRATKGQARAVLGELRERMEEEDS